MDYTEYAPARMSRQEAIKLLDRHGIGPISPSRIRFGPTAEMSTWIDGSDFDSEMGVRDWYKGTDVYEWLGY